MTVKVIRSAQVSLNPRAECLGDDPDPNAETNCQTIWYPAPGTLSAVKVHIQVNPTHQVGVIHETRSMYEASQ